MDPSTKTVSAALDRLLSDLTWFLPETLLSLGVALLLVVRLFGLPMRRRVTPAAVLVAGLAALVAVLQFLDFPFVTPPRRGTLPTYFGGLLSADGPALFGRALLTIGLTLTVILTCLTRPVDGRTDAEMGVLLLGATLGMMLMVQSANLLMVFVGVEMASVPSYVLAGFARTSRRASEAALKYVVYGAAASGTMLYGVSLLTARYGRGDLNAVALGVQASAAGGIDLLTLAGLTLIAVGLAFKLSAVPFHLWCPDVFTGATAEVAAFLGTASKAAAAILSAKVVTAFAFAGTLTPIGQIAPEYTELARGMGTAVIVLAMLTMTVGNVAALAQTDLQRMLAYSTIAHAGYILMAIAAFDPKVGTPALLFYLGAYLLSNLLAFASVALVRDRVGSTSVTAFAGMGARWPVAAVGLTVALVSLLGLPPLAGFAGKFLVFSATVEAGREAASAGWPRLAAWHDALVAVAALNTVVSADYYLRVVKTMFLDASPEGAAPISRPSPAANLYLVAMSLGVLALGVFWDPLLASADAAVRGHLPPSLTRGLG